MMLCRQHYFLFSTGAIFVMQIKAQRNISMYSYIIQRNNALFALHITLPLANNKHWQTEERQARADATYIFETRFICVTNRGRGRGRAQREQNM